MARHSGILAWRSHGQRNLVGYSSWGSRKLDTTEHAACTYLREETGIAFSAVCGLWMGRHLLGKVPHVGVGDAIGCGAGSSLTSTTSESSQNPACGREGASSTQEGGSWLCQAWVPLSPTPHVPKLPPVERLPQGPPVGTSAGLRASPHVVCLESTLCLH